MSNASGITVEIQDEKIIWRLDGVIHRDSGPAVIYANGRVCWYRDGLMHRDDGPANEMRLEDGTIVDQIHYHHGLHASPEGHPAILRQHEDGVRFAQWVDDQGAISRHEEEGPALAWVYPSGSSRTEYYLSGVLHRTKGPSITSVYAEARDPQRSVRTLFCWHRFGKRHREDGPAEVTEGGLGYYWIDGESLYDERAYRDKLKSLGLSWSRPLSVKAEAVHLPDFLQDTGYPDLEAEYDLARRFEAGGAVYVPSADNPVAEEPLAELEAPLAPEVVEPEAGAGKELEEGKRRSLARLEKMKSRLKP